MRYQRPDVGGDGVRQAPQHQRTTLPYREAHGREGQAALGSRGRHLDGGGPTNAHMMLKTFMPLHNSQVQAPHHHQTQIVQ